MLVTRPLTEDAVQAEPDEHGDQREDYDDCQASVSILSMRRTNIVRQT